MSNVGFTSINWKKLQVIGGGGSGAVFTDGTYAIKLGSVDMNEIAALREYAKHGLAVPIYFVSERMYIPSRIRAILAEIDVPVYGNMRNFVDKYMWDGHYLGVVIMGIATPIVDPTIDTNADKSIIRRCMNIVSWIHERIDELGLEDYFADDHEYNIGVYNGQPVILDLRVPNW